MRIETGSSQQVQQKQPENQQEKQPKEERAWISPAVRRLARETGVDLRQLEQKFSGKRISEEDIRNFVKEPADTLNSGGEKWKLPDFSVWGEIERKPISTTRRQIARHMSVAAKATASVTQFDKADVTDLEKMVKQFSNNSRKLTITSFLIKAAAETLKNFSRFNASFDPDAEEIIYKHYFHIGVAVETERGLLVPVIRDADKKNIFEIADELQNTAEQARLGKIKPEQMQGGCFTVTNLGGIGGTFFTPIINWPESAILGAGRSRTEAVYVDNQLYPRKIISLSLTYDHRIIDGSYGARFITRIVGTLEQPFSFLA
jgi:pyruvate dehydrogenase E2 component (dihydrolipoamide acetyltransferase)